MKDCHLWLEASSERLMAIAGLDRSALLRPRIMPALKMFVQRGEEMTAHDDIRELLRELSRYVDMQVIIILSVDRCVCAGL